MSASASATVEPEGFVAETMYLEQEHKRALYQMRVMKQFIERFYIMYPDDVNANQIRHLSLRYLQVVKKMNLSQKVRTVVEKLENRIRMSSSNEKRDDWYFYLYETTFEDEDYEAIDKYLNVM